MTEDWGTAERVADSIRLLIGKREPAYQDEAAIRLVELQTWIYFPDKGRVRE